MLTITVKGMYGEGVTLEDIERIKSVTAWLEANKVSVKAIAAFQTMRWADGVLEATCFSFAEDGRRVMTPGGNFLSMKMMIQGVGRPPKEICDLVGNEVTA